MPNPSTDERRLALERERFAFDKAQAAQATPDRRRLGAIVSAAVAVVAAAFTGTQVWTTYITKQQELTLADRQTAAQIDQTWRAELLGFLERHERRLFSADTAESRRALALLELSFPEPYVRPVRSKLSVLLSSTDSASERRVVEELLKPLIAQFDRTSAAFGQYRPGNLIAEGELRDGNQRARDLLLEHRDLIPEALRGDAARLVEHYEVWLQEYFRLRGGERPDIMVPVYTGPRGYPFPAESERRFRAELARLTATEDPG